MKTPRIWKMLVPPAAVPLALWLFVALAGPGGPVEVGDGPPPAGAGHGHHVDAQDGAGVDSQVPQSDAAAVDEGQATANGDDGTHGCEWALAEQAKARERLEGHTADLNTPAGGAEGNQAALDKQCGGAFADGAAGDATPAADAATNPGKSEQAPAGPPAGGQAQGQGQATADARGNGPADAPGKNKP